MNQHVIIFRRMQMNISIRLGSKDITSALAKSFWKHEIEKRKSIWYLEFINRQK